MDSKKNKKQKVKNLNVKIPEQDYIELQRIADDIGVSLSSLIRMVIYSKIKKVKNTGKCADFLDDLI